MGLRVLVADDAGFIRRMMGAMLSQEGHQVVAEAADGHQALLAYEHARPDVVIMDIVMPVMDGITATRQLKGRYPEARVVVCSAVAERDTVVQALSAGAVDFVVKPVARERLLLALRRAVGATVPRAPGGAAGEALPAPSAGRGAAAPLATDAQREVART
ncbi:MAG: response regulator [Acetobacteraceae bacterium]|nr:response regulator [Acetobacteraceae bacterium]